MLQGALLLIRMFLGALLQQSNEADVTCGLYRLHASVYSSQRRLHPFDVTAIVSVYLAAA
jgi:hypothetical protein